MIPYIEIHSIGVGPLTIQIWGLLVALGIIAGLLVSYRLAQKYFLSTNVLLDAAIWSIIGALIGGRLFFVLFYSLDYFLIYPLDILKFWQGGASSLGGFFGTIVAILLFCRKRHFTFYEFLPYLDVGAVGLWLGWGIGRLGCFLIHDHPGILTGSFLAVDFPTGARYDLGLLESILAFVIFLVFIIIFKYLIKKRCGLVVFYSFGLYAVLRFFLDFLRAIDLEQSDYRYLSLTPAQWGMILILVGILTLLLFWNKIACTKGIEKNKKLKIKMQK